MANLKDVIYLSAEDYNTLYTNGTVTINGTTLTYDANNVYIVPDDTDIKISTALANYIAKSNTAGLVKNDGTIDTNTYLTSIPLTLSPQTTGFKISGGTTSKTLTVGSDYTLGAACAKGVTDNSSSTAVTSSDTNLITGRTLHYHCVNKGFLTSLVKGTTTGSGNAVTDITINGDTITLDKGSTFLTSHQTVPTMGVIINNTYNHLMGTSVSLSNISMSASTGNTDYIIKMQFNTAKKWFIIPISSATSNYFNVGYGGSANSSYTASSGSSSQYAVCYIKYSSATTTSNFSALVIGF